MKCLTMVWGVLPLVGALQACVGAVESPEPEQGGLVEGKTDHAADDPDQGSTSWDGGGGDGDGGVDEERWGLRCVGQARSCRTMTAEECSRARGCLFQGECSGLPRPCDEIYGEQACDEAGCLWSSMSGQCVGFAPPCRSYHRRDRCGAQVGCHWAGPCLGAARPCDVVSLDDCEYHPGCRLAYLRLDD